MESLKGQKSKQFLLGWGCHRGLRRGWCGRAQVTGRDTRHVLECLSLVGGTMRGRETVLLLKLHLPPEHDRCLHRASWWGAHTEKRVGKGGSVGFWPTLRPHPGSEVQGGLQMLTFQHCSQQLEDTFVGRVGRLTGISCV